ncbi:hypothetical protein PGTUg99_005219 [Puccinia graminis f. sp. tritici]|uniref:Aminotransferase class V domain-containing protein n=2 Tax=Puccinia graminis f. sp. tritici TaxID=56615 RepID=E3KH70_PUCGT|nr:uncharacterized protein PGTG_09358 [Puccinia graminis f. sp. tritici CRL 75-36-700-3]EFP83645.1 hypothetical protein PGTG_09358 [Puccinia graminis f. sp. tritici CRL 75-36-700-3]KAA1128311.1 hypothetical protein PGTUg99_005219 [Puccinia graminis f. sp. tritici]
MKLCGINFCFPGFNGARNGAIQLPDDDESDENLSQGITPVGNSSPEFLSFLAKNPEYNSPFLDELRQSDFKRLDDPSHPSCYLDYTGAGLYPESLAASFADLLTKNVYGNPHSTNPSSQLSSRANEAAKHAVLAFLDANPNVYDLVWTSNATGALKILAEGYPYQAGQSLVISTDSHNSVNGMRAFADRAGAKVEYLDLPDDMRGLRISSHELTERLLNLKGSSASPGLFVTTAQSNITGLKAPIHELVPLASSLGFTTLLDAAALLPTTKLSLEKLHGSLDAVAFSIYKMIGLPTGLGALVIKKELLEKLRKPWFCGGTVQLVQAPGAAVTMEQGPARFEDGTTDFLSTLIIPPAFATLEKALSNSLGARVAALTFWTVDQMSKIKHEVGNSPFILVRSPNILLPKAEMAKLHGGLIAFEVMDKTGEYVSCEVIEYAASLQGISLRAGCMCNPGGAASIMKMKEMMSELRSGETKKDIQAKWGVRAAGVTRASFGLASNFSDAHYFIKFMESLSRAGELEKMMSAFYNKPRDTSAC